MVRLSHLVPRVPLDRWGSVELLESVRAVDVTRLVESSDIDSLLAGALVANERGDATNARRLAEAAASKVSSNLEKAMAQLELAVASDRLGLTGSCISACARGLVLAGELEPPCPPLKAHLEVLRSRALRRLRLQEEARSLLLSAWGRVKNSKDTTSLRIRLDVHHDRHGARRRGIGSPILLR